MYSKFLEIISYSVESIYVYKEMYKHKDLYKNNNAYIIMLNNCAMMAIVRLCNIFGSNREENHWKNVLKSKADDFQKSVILEVFEDLNEFNNYWETLKNFRDKYVTHFIDDSYVMPYFDIGLKLLKKSYVFVMEQYGTLEFDEFVDNTISNVEKILFK